MWSDYLTNYARQAAELIMLRSRQIHEGDRPSTPQRRYNMYGVITTVPAPVAMYDAVHAEMIKRAGTSIDGLLVHIGRATTDGFQTLEVWESKEYFDRANTGIVLPLVAELTGDRPQPSIGEATEVFDLHGLVIPGGNILV
jgi:hypothetical protein